MKLRPGWRRTVGVLFTALAVAGALVVPSSAANASTIIDGDHWAWSYHYTSSTEFTVTGGLPGVFLHIAANDVNGDRTLFPLIIDTQAGGFCAGLGIFSNGSPVMDPLIACDTSAVNQTQTFHGEATIVLFQSTPEGIVGGAFYLESVPDFDSDPDLRTDGTEFRWHYTDASNFDYDLVVPGAHVAGNGWRDGPDTRGAQFTIFWTGGGSCVEGNIQSESDPVIPGPNIGVACPFGSPGFGRLTGMHDGIEVRVFSGPHALMGRIAMPLSIA
jgi:hypothetical protein